jgi:hypothetical protein
MLDFRVRPTAKIATRLGPHDVSDSDERSAMSDEEKQTELVLEFDSMISGSNELEQSGVDHIAHCPLPIARFIPLILSDHP